MPNKKLHCWARWLSYLPYNVWGSSEKADAWIKQGGMKQEDTDK